LRYIDQFGKRISFSIDGQQTFNTAVGGVTTLVVMTLFLILLVSKSITVFGKTNPNLTMQTLNKDFDVSDDTFNLTRKDFMFAVTDIPRDLGRIEAVMIDADAQSETIIPMVSCKNIAA
jgi:hypothetical protein